MPACSRLMRFWTRVMLKRVSLKKQKLCTSVVVFYLFFICICIDLVDFTSRFKTVLLFPQKKLNTWRINTYHITVDNNAYFGHFVKLKEQWLKIQVIWDFQQRLLTFRWVPAHLAMDKLPLMALSWRLLRWGPPDWLSGQPPLRINTLVSQLALERHHSNTTTKTWVAYGNLHLACKSIQGTWTAPGVHPCVYVPSEFRTVFEGLWKFRRWWSVASCPQMSVDILGTSCDQCRSTVQ